MNYFKNLLTLIFLLFTTNITQAKSISRTTTSSSATQPAPATAVKQPIVQSFTAPTQPKPPVIPQHPIAPPKTYTEALAYIKTNVQASDVLIGNTFTQNFINFVKSLNLYAVETEALLQAGISLYATWTGNNENDKRILASLKNAIQTVIQANPITPVQPIAQPRPIEQFKPTVQPPKPTIPTQPSRPVPQQTVQSKPIEQPKPVIPAQPKEQITPAKPIVTTQPTLPSEPLPQPSLVKPIEQPKQTTPSKPIVVTQPTLPSKPTPQPKIELPKQTIPIQPKEQTISAKPAEQILPTTSKNKSPQDLFGKAKKLEGYDDIYVGIGTSAAGETIYFAMEKLNNERFKIWEKYRKALQDYRKVVDCLRVLNRTCTDQKFLDAQKKKPYSDLFNLNSPYTTQLLSRMCPNTQKLAAIFGQDGIGSGITGFAGMLERYNNKRDDIYVVYACRQPIIGPFKPKKEINLSSFTLEDFETAYSDLIICVCIDMMEKLKKPISAEHRGIFKNPFNEIQGTYKNIGLKLHGWAGTVEKQFFNKKYATIFPTDQAGRLLHRAVKKDGGLYLGTDKQPFRYNVYYDTTEEQQAIKEKFPPIKSELIGDVPTISSALEDLHVFDLNALSKYYTE